MVSKEFLEGNEAIARASIKAGCNFFAGYPITPASSILHYMLSMMPKNKGVTIQAEDEIASIGFCIGAAMSGKKVMTATSGPGISLYSENIGLGIISETPMVIVNIQRQGPATGSATKGAEGDIQFTRWVTSGGLPIIALSPASVSEAYELTFHAFNLAEQYRTPVFVLANKEIGLTKESVDLDNIKLPQLFTRKTEESESEFIPHNFIKTSDIPKMSAFGDKHIVRNTTSSHGKDGYLTKDPKIIQEMINHYTEKINSAADDIALVKKDYQENANVLIISYGIISRSVIVAVAKARASGKKVSSLIIQSLWPTPEKTIVSAMKNVKKVIVPEMNMGQYILEIQRLAPAEIEIIGINKMDTTLISPDTILTEGGLL